MNSSKPEKRQTPSEFDRAEELLKIAQREPPAKKVKLGPYHHVIRELLRKEYTYAGIGDFLTKHLGRNVSRSQVFGFVKRNPAIFDQRVVGGLKASGERYGVIVREADERTGGGADIFKHGGIKSAPTFFKGLPGGIYGTDKGKLYRIVQQEDGSLKGTFLRRLPKNLVSEFNGSAPVVFMLGKYQGFQVEQAPMKEP